MSETRNVGYTYHVVKVIFVDLSIRFNVFHHRLENFTDMSRKAWMSEYRSHETEALRLNSMRVVLFHELLYGI